MTPEQRKFMKSMNLDDFYSSTVMRIPMEAGARRSLNLLPHDPEVVDYTEKFCRDILAEFEAWAKKHFKLKDSFRIIMHFDWGCYRDVSRGGSYSGRWRSYELAEKLKRGPGVSLAMKHHVPVDPKNTPDQWTFNEYSHIKADPEIGTFVGSWEDCLRVLVIHEAAHAIQHNKSEWEKSSHLREIDRKQSSGHKLLWQQIYREARVYFGYTRKEG